MLLGLLVTITDVTTEHQKWPKISTHIMKTSVFAQKNLCPRPKPSAGHRSKQAVPSSEYLFSQTENNNNLTIYFFK